MKRRIALCRLKNQELTRRLMQEIGEIREHTRVKRKEERKTLLGLGTSRTLVKPHKRRKEKDEEEESNIIRSTRARSRGNCLSHIYALYRFN